MALTTVNTEGIKDGTIKNIDVKSDAAIEASKLDSPLQFADDHKISFGTDGTGDLEIYHDGSHSYIKNTTGNFHIGTDGFLAIYGGQDLGETSAKFTNDGSVELYHNNSKKFETNSEGVQIHGKTYCEGNVDMPDNAKLLIGDSDDIEIYHDAYHSYIDHTGAGHFYIYGNGVNNVYLRANSSEDSIVAETNGSVKLYYDGTKKLNTNTGGVAIDGNLYMTDVDNRQIKLGVSDDLKIYHDGSNSYVEDAGTGSLYLKTNSHIYMIDSSDHTLLEAVENGKIALRYANTEVFTTTSSGVTIKDPDCTGSPGLLHIDAGTGASDQEYITFEYGSSNTDSGGIRRDGTSQTPEFFAGSDKRIKKDIVDMPAVLSKLNQIQLKSFNYKEGGGSGRGPIAQDLISIFPNKVKREDSDDGTGDTVPNDVAPWTVGTGFTWELIKAVQELSAEINTLKTKITALEAN